MSPRRPAGPEVGPFPVPLDARHVLVFGGTFDPPHVGHVELPRAAREAVGCDWLVYVPAARSPHKAEAPSVSDADRLAMLSAALEGAERASISTIELDRGAAGQASYTVDTLRAISTLCPGLGLRLLIGADQAGEFHRWREPRAILRLADPVVMLRRPLEDARSLMSVLGAHWEGAALKAWEGRIVGVPPIDASATELRRELALHGPGSAVVRKLLPEGVRRVIAERGLYSPPPATRT